MACGVIAGLMASVLGGCGHPGERAERLGFEWSRHDAPGYARLVLAAPNRPDEALMLGCQPHSGAVELDVKARPGDPAVLELRSGETWNRYRGVGLAVEDGAGWRVQVRLAQADPVLRSLGDSGALTLKLGGRRLDAPNGFAPAHDFLKACRAPG